MTGIGHNSISKTELKSLVDRIETLEAEKWDLQADIKAVYKQASAGGYDAKILRKAIAFRKLDKHAREEQQAMLDVYLDALGDLASTPLGKSALEHAGA